MPEIGQLAHIIKRLCEFTCHSTGLFPEDTDDYVTLTAGTPANTFGEWAEIQDDKANKFSALFDEAPGYITALILEEASVKDERYLLEVAYCAEHIMIARSRFMKVATKVDVSHLMRIRSARIPTGEEIYYRLKCETALATAELQLRYYNV